MATFKACNYEFQVDIQAADGDGNAVTTVMLWDGDGDDVVYYDYTHTDDDEYCLCCFDPVQSSNISSVSRLRRYLLQQISFDRKPDAPTSY